MKRVGISVLLILATAACASSSREGWSGAGTVPFDRAKDQCEAEAAPVNDKKARYEAVSLCMAKFGWLRQ